MTKDPICGMTVDKATLPLVRDALAGLTADPGRRRAVGERMQRIAELAERTIKSPYDRARSARKLARIREAFAIGAIVSTHEQPTKE